MPVHRIPIRVPSTVNRAPANRRARGPTRIGPGRQGGLPNQRWSGACLRENRAAPVADGNCTMLPTAQLGFDDSAPRRVYFVGVAHDIYSSRRLVPPSTRGRTLAPAPGRHEPPAPRRSRTTGLSRWLRHHSPDIPASRMASWAFGCIWQPYLLLSFMHYDRDLARVFCMVYGQRRRAASTSGSGRAQITRWPSWTWRRRVLSLHTSLRHAFTDRQGTEPTCTRSAYPAREHGTLLSASPDSDVFERSQPWPPRRRRAGGARRACSWMFSERDYARK